MGVGLVTGHELRILRVLARGPLYEGTFALVCAVPAKKVRSSLRSLTRQGFVEIAEEIGPQTYRLTEAGEEIRAAMTP